MEWGRSKEWRTVGGASAHGAAGAGQRGPAGAQGSGANEAELGAVIEFIDEILRADQQAPRKQRHTAHRIWERIREERPESHGGGGDGASLRAVSQERAGHGERETFVPQSYDWGRRRRWIGTRLSRK